MTKSTEQNLQSILLTFPEPSYGVHMVITWSVTPVTLSKKRLTTLDATHYILLSSFFISLSSTSIHARGNNSISQITEMTSGEKYSVGIFPATITAFETSRRRFSTASFSSLVTMDSFIVLRCKKRCS